MGSGDIGQDKTNDLQPGADVSSKPEDSTSTQGVNTEETGVIVESEADHQAAKGQMSQAQTYAAWQKEKQKRKERARELEEAKERSRKLEERLAQLESQVGEVKRGERPNPLNYSDDKEFWADYKKWEQGDQSPAPQAKPQSDGERLQPVTNDKAEFHLYQSEESLRGHLKDYDAVKQSASARLSQAFGSEQAPDALASTAYALGLDPAKIFYAIDKNPSKVAELAMVATDTAEVRKLLTELESKVKVREQKKIDSQPEPNLTSNGSVDVAQAAVDDAFKRWQNEPTTRNYTALRQARAKAKQAKG